MDIGHIVFLNNTTSKQEHLK